MDDRVTGATVAGTGRASVPPVRPVMAVLGAAALSHGMNDLLQSLIPAVYPVLKQEFALSFGQIGLITLVLAVVAFLPLLGWLNWVVIPIGIVGAAVGALSAANGGRNLNVLLVVICSLRLMLGHGIF